MRELFDPGETDAVFPSLDTSNFLLGDATVVPSESVLEQLTPDNFSFLLENTIDDYDSPTTAKVIQRFAQYSVVEFIEPEQGEEEFTTTANRIEGQISSFIESNEAPVSLDLLSEQELMQIASIYNPNNLLAFTADLITRLQDDLKPAELEIIYRYHTVLRLIEKALVQISQDRIAEMSSSREEVVGHRTWAGDVRPYGVEKDGVIDPQDYNRFSGDEEPAKRIIVIDGKEINLRRAVGEIISGNRD